MHIRRLFLFLTLIAGFILTGNEAAAQFGKNKVQYREFEWKYIESKHFDVYFYTGERYLAKFAALEAERALVSIQNTLNYRINKRIKLIVFNTHNEFQQNNVISQFMPEGVGGVTELFKNRVVVPFQGDYSQFRHVIHHELVHAVINDMFYGGTFQSALASGGNFQLPLWMNEGICEYESLGGFDAETDMFMRDITIHEMLPGLKNLRGYFAYRGGQTFYWYVAEKYGKEKVGDFINRLKILRNVEAAFKSSFNMTFEEFSEKWERDIKKLYWPDLDRFDNPKDYAKQITKHEKHRTFYNTSPAISPNGERMAYISAPEGVFGVYVTDLDKPEEYRKVVSSFRDQDFEDLNVLTPGISWNPEGTRLAISAKAGGQDAVFLVDVDEEDYIKKTFGLKSITSVEWSPDGDKVVFVGVVDEDSDLFIYNIKNDSLKRITNDLFSDQFPTWSPDSKSIYFVSDRGDYLTTTKKARKFEMWDYDIGRSDIYKLEYESGNISRITNSPEYGKTSVVVAPEETHILYASNKNGIGNVYMKDLATGQTRPLTNSITGITQLSLSPDGSKLLFATQIEGAYDIFLLRYPMDRNLDMEELPLTTYRQRQMDKKKAIDELARAEAEEEEEAEEEPMQVSQYGDFKIDFGRQKLVEPNDAAAEREKLQQADAMKDGAGDTSFVVKDYKIKFTPDVIVGNPGYSTYWGFQGVTQMLFSDILGNHQIYFQANLFRDLLNSSFFVAYNYLPEIIDYQVSANHQALFVYLDNYLYRFRNYGASVSAWYPFDLFNRLEFGMNWINVTRENVDVPDANDASRMLFVPQARYVHDDVLWGMFAPRKGSRYYLSLKGTPKFSEAGLGFMTVDFDYRKYFEITSFLHFAMRGTAGASIGPDPQDFYLGGTQNWINREFKNGELPFEDPEDFAFMQFAMPMRGYPVSELKGSKFFLTNLELRFPLFRALLAGPVPVLFQSVQGSFFLDVGGAWDDVFRSYEQDASGNVIDRDLLMSTGIGVRTLVIGLPLKMDIAWRNEYTGWSQPQYLFSLGLDF